MFLLQNYKSGEKFDEHWSPIYTFCTPCSINYTIIAKMETFERDSEYIIRQAGLETLLLNKLPHKKIKSITNQSSGQTKNYIEKYYKLFFTLTSVFNFSFIGIFRKLILTL